MQADPRHLLPGRRRGHLRARRVVAQEVPVHGGAEMTEDGALAAGRHRRRPATLLRQHRAGEGGDTTMDPPHDDRSAHAAVPRAAPAAAPATPLPIAREPAQRPRERGCATSFINAMKIAAHPLGGSRRHLGGGGARAVMIWPPEEWRRSSGRSAGRGAPAPRHRQRGQGELQCRGRGRCRRGAPCGARGWGSRARTPHSPTLGRPGFTDAPQPRRLAVSPEEVVRVALEAVAPVRSQASRGGSPWPCERVAGQAPHLTQKFASRRKPSCLLVAGRPPGRTAHPNRPRNPAARSGPTLPR